jgi:signal transduction histidine kinase
MSKEIELTNEQLLGELARRMQETDSNQQELDQLNSTIRDLSLRLNESEALKSHFISNISNELVNPFTSILALAENILSVEKENWKKVIQMVALIHTEVFNLDFQLKNIFAAAKIEAGETFPEITLVNVDKLMGNLINSFKYEARRKRLKINYASKNSSSKETTLYFKSDAEKIYLVVSNLLSNAIKFSFDEGEIQIQAIKEEDQLHISVKDFGQGISKANEQIIFDRFKRIDNGINSINRGHGLGLSIIKALTDLLSGKIHFTSELGKGATFHLHITESSAETTGISTDADELFFKEELF